MSCLYSIHKNKVYMRVHARKHYAAVEIHPYRDDLLKNLLKNLFLKVQKVHFRSTCVAQKPQGARTICLCSRLLFYSKRS